MTTDRSLHLRDLFERVAATYVEAFTGALIALPLWNAWQPQQAVDLSPLAVAAWSAVPAALAVVKAEAARFVGRPDSASLHPKV